MNQSRNGASRGMHFMYPPGSLQQLEAAIAKASPRIHPINQEGE